MIKECYKNSILVDPSIKSDTYIWFKDGYSRIKGNFLEVAKQLYNLTTEKIIHKDGTETIIQNTKLYIDTFGYGIELKDILERQYGLNVYKCKNYRKDLLDKLEKQYVIYEDDNDLNFIY